MNEEMQSKIAEYKQLTEQAESIKQRIDALKGYFLQAAENDLIDTKYKTVDYYGPVGERLTVSEGSKLTIISVEYIRKVFGDIAKDMIKETTKYDIVASFVPIIKAAITRNYIKGQSLEDVLRSATSDEKVLKALRKKIKGEFAKDVDRFVAVLGIDREAAKELAYLAEETANWEKIQKFLTVSGYSEEQFDDIIEKLKAAIIFDETTTVKFDAGDDTAE